MTEFDEVHDSNNESIYAFNSDMEIVYIEDVPIEHRGLAGDYYCLGCKKTMQVVLPKIKRKKYFRHHVSKNHASQCTYSQETHRHFLAKQYLKDLNKIKVPSIIKYSDSDPNDGLFIKESRVIEGFSVVTEKAIYEDENCNIQIANKNATHLEKYLHMIPDAILLDSKGNPKLIVEFVATHKPDPIKLMKLKRLGIDAVQVSVPKSSPEDIKKSLLVTTRTKWLYNYEEDNTQFISLSKEDPRRVYETDDLQRRLFEEGYKCRSAQIGELIRSIEKLLESELYAETERKFKSEIQRITEITERTRSELDNVREQHIRKGIEQHQERRNEFQNYSSNLERRYNSKRSRVEEEIRIIGEENDRIKQIINDSKTESLPSELISKQLGKRKDLAGRIIEIRARREEIQPNFRETSIRFKQEFEGLRDEIRKHTFKVQKDINSISRTISEEEDAAERYFETSQRELQKKIDDIESTRKSIEIRIGREEEQFVKNLSTRLATRRQNDENLRRQYDKEYINGNYKQAVHNSSAYERISKLETVTITYSRHLNLYRRVENKNK